MAPGLGDALRSDEARKPTLPVAQRLELGRRDAQGPREQEIGEVRVPGQDRAVQPRADDVTLANLCDRAIRGGKPSSMKRM